METENKDESVQPKMSPTMAFLTKILENKPNLLGYGASRTYINFYWRQVGLDLVKDGYDEFKYKTSTHLRNVIWKRLKKKTLAKRELKSVVYTEEDKLIFDIYNMNLPENSTTVIDEPEKSVEDGDSNKEKPKSSRRKTNPTDSSTKREKASDLDVAYKEAKYENILLQNKKLKLEIYKLKHELETLDPDALDNISLDDSDVDDFCADQ
ncbi:hypothetical protein M3Y97_00652400 [Aphelenchoides bicaudatus]|nr:hypothetical protein M3Y97_00652400 [Aphelenchoides bicaudatus]